MPNDSQEIELPLNKLLAEPAPVKSADSASLDLPPQSNQSNTLPRNTAEPASRYPITAEEELKALLAELQETNVQERARITREYVRIAEGIPGSSSATIALLNKTILFKIADLQHRLLAVQTVQVDSNLISEKLAEKIPTIETLQQIATTNSEATKTIQSDTALVVGEIRSAGHLLTNQMTQSRRAHTFFGLALALVYALALAVAAAWIINNTQRTAETRINEQITIGTKDALARLNSNSQFLKDLLNTGVGASETVDAAGHVVLQFHGRPGVTELSNPQWHDGILSVTIQH
jgi:hypothetical protein